MFWKEVTDLGVTVCSRCIMDNVSDNTITFNHEGQCNYCTDTLERKDKEYFPNDIGKKKLDALMDKIKKDGVGKKYDCMVGISGGVDSSYVAYLGYKYGLRMLAVHIDDGLDTNVAKRNIDNLCDKANLDLLLVEPDLGQYKDLLLSFFKASVPNLAMPQDNILLAALNDTAKKYGLKYFLSGANFALECILERSGGVNACDDVHIRAVHNQFGFSKIDKLRLISLPERYLSNKYNGKIIKYLPLNYIDYNLQRVLVELKDFCNYDYYGGKHYESILTRFLQCYYLPTKYNFDKRKSHLSSMIISGQITREEALRILKKSAYVNNELKDFDFEFIANYFNLSRAEFKQILELPPKKHQDYNCSQWNKLSGVARKFRRFLEE